MFFVSLKNKCRTRFVVVNEPADKILEAFAAKDIPAAHIGKGFFVLAVTLPAPCLSGYDI
jgi:hypothetical protein